jgi:hypothetical protein
LRYHIWNTECQTQNVAIASIRTEGVKHWLRLRPDNILVWNSIHYKSKKHVMWILSWESLQLTNYHGWKNHRILISIAQNKQASWSWEELHANISSNVIKMYLNSNKYQAHKHLAFYQASLCWQLDILSS